MLLIHTLLDLLTIQTSRHDGNTAYKHNNEVTIFAIFYFGVCPIIIQQESTNSDTQSKYTECYLLYW
jgi:hypothetical protein